MGKTSKKLHKIMPIALLVGCVFGYLNACSWDFIIPPKIMPFILAAILLASVKLFERLILKSAYPKSMYSRVIYPMAFGTIVGGLLRSMLGC